MHSLNLQLLGNGYVYNEREFLQDSLNSTRLRWSVSFLPLARSSATLDYYFAVMDQSRADGAIADGVTKVVAMDLGTLPCRAEFNPTDPVLISKATKFSKFFDGLAI